MRARRGVREVLDGGRGEQDELRNEHQGWRRAAPGVSDVYDE